MRCGTLLICIRQSGRRRRERERGEKSIWLKRGRGRGRGRGGLSEKRGTQKVVGWSDSFGVLHQQFNSISFGSKPVSIIEERLGSNMTPLRHPHHFPCNPSCLNLPLSPPVLVGLASAKISHSESWFFHRPFASFPSFLSFLFSFSGLMLNLLRVVYN